MRHFFIQIIKYNNCFERQARFCVKVSNVCIRVKYEYREKYELEVAWWRCLGFLPMSVKQPLELLCIMENIIN